MVRVTDSVTLNDWQRYFGEQVPSTQNSGNVWTDKSVMTDADVLGVDGVTLDNENGFLVALSAIASNTAVSGMTNIPTDTMLVLDLSSSLYRDAEREPSVLRAALDAINAAVGKLQSANRYNRVGVVVYSGGENGALSDTSHAQVLLPLGRYTSSSQAVLSLVVEGGKAKAVAVANGVTDERGKPVTASKTLTETADAYTQLGLLTALEEMTDNDARIPDDAAFLAGKTRLPVLVLIADGAPTAATAAYSRVCPADIRTDPVTAYGKAPVTFLTQLTAAFVKNALREHYNGTTPLIYTVPVGENDGGDLLDPRNSDAFAQAVMANPDAFTSDEFAKAVDNRAATGYWQIMLTDGFVDITASDGKDKVTMRVEPTVAETFSARFADRYFVDNAFTAASAQEVDNAVFSILETIDHRSHYHPTLVREDADATGHISFVDKIGEHMHVTDIKGIVIDDVLYSGALLSENFVTGGGSLGTYNDPKPLGDELVWAVRDRIGVDVDTARDLLGLAYAHGQLAFTDEENFSNYIGWYANSKGEYLGFWYEGITSMPDPDDPHLEEDERPAYIMRSYGFLGALDERHGVSASDLMYATVQHRVDIRTGEEMMSLAIPASLIPMVTYDVTLNADGTPASMKTSGATSPFRLVYEVALDEAIDSVSVSEIVDSDYGYRGDDGAYYFYTNRFEEDDYTGYGASNTYSYFIPSRENARYYYTANSTVYADQNGTVFTGTLDPNGTYYRAEEIFVCDDTPSNAIAYEKISSVSLQKAVRNDDGSWYIPEGTVRTMLDEYIVTKDNNATDTLSYAYVPFVDAQYTYYVGATLGNNGRLAVMPETGIRLIGTVSTETADTIINYRLIRTDIAENAVYAARLTHTNGTQEEVTVTFQNGVADVMLLDGEKLAVYGMPAGAAYRIEQQEHDDYLLTSVNGNSAAEVWSGVLEKATFADVTFVNVQKGFGNLTITNRVMHGFGTSYDVPDKPFTLYADLGKAYARAVVKVVHSADSSLTALTADENGRVAFTLCHGEQLELVGLREGTVVTVWETDPPAGFTPVYYGNSEGDRNDVVIVKDNSLAMVVANVYAPTAIAADMDLGGKLTLVGRENDQWLAEDVYTLALQRYRGDTWETIATQTVDSHTRNYDFSDALQKERFDKPGTYSYQVVEPVGDVKGVLYDPRIHTFSVVVADPDMTGLRVTEVVSHQDTVTVSGNTQNGFVVTADFENRCSTTEAIIAIDIKAHIQNESGSEIASRAGFRYGLFEQGAASPIVTSPFTDMLGETRLVASFDAVGTYTYDLRAVIPEITETGIHFDQTVYTVTVTVTADNGALVAEVTVAQGTPVFRNRYELSEATLSLTATKRLSGRNLRDGEFTFAVKNADAVLSVGKNDALGNVTFDRELTFTAVGDYYYDVMENAGTLPGVTYDARMYRLHIRVFDGGDGRLYTHHHVINAASDEIVFYGAYDAAPVSIALSGNTTLSGRDLVNEEFHFLLIGDASDDDVLMLSAANRTDGTFRFDPIVFDTAGTYEYSVQELQSSTTHGITFDKSLYGVTVHVTDNGNAQLVAEYTVRKNDEPSLLVFHNAYSPAPVELLFDGVKEMDGRELQSGEYDFTLYRADGDWEHLSELQTVHNDAHGTFAFDTVTIREGGVYRFVIKERFGGETIDGVTYDEQYYRVLVVATDNHRGKLTVDKAMIDSTNTFCTAMRFVNRYAVSDGAELIVGGKMTMSGRPIEKDECRFLLYAADDTGAPIGSVLASATNAGDGNFAFAPVELHTIGTHRFAVVQDVTALDRVTLDKRIRLITVVTEDNGVGGLSIVSQTVTDEDGNVLADGVVFENVYTAPNTPTASTTVPTTVTTLPKAPQTGHTSLGVLWASLLGVAGVAVLLMYARKKQSS